MALLDDTLKGWGGMLIGLGAAIALPSVGGAANATLRPLAKAIIRGALAASAWIKEIASEASEQMNDLVAEVRAERRPTREPRARATKH